jgi:hypothetical protein
MEPKDLMKVLFVAADANTDEEKARVAWRASDYMWRSFPRYPLNFCREFNFLCQVQKLPWVKNLWSKEEIEKELETYRIRNEEKSPIPRKGK